MQRGGIDIWGWYMRMPPVTRAYLTGSVLCAVATALDFITPLHLYYNFRLIFYRGEIWRLVTNFLYFGSLRIEFILHMYFVVHYCGYLERNSFYNRTPDFIFFILIGTSIMMGVAPFLNELFFGSALTTMMVYVWSRRNPGMQLWLFGVLMGHSITGDLLGIGCGHVYFFLADVYPTIAAARGWQTKEILHTPRILYYIFGMTPPDARDPAQQANIQEQAPRVIDDIPLRDNEQPPAQPPQPRPQPPQPRQNHREEEWGVLPEDLDASSEDEN